MKEYIEILDATIGGLKLLTPLGHYDGKQILDLRISDIENLKTKFLSLQEENREKVENQIKHTLALYHLNGFTNSKDMSKTIIEILISEGII